MSPADKPTPNPILAVLVAWGIPAVLGGVLALLLAKSGDSERAATLQRDVIELKAEVTYMKNNYTPVRQTENLQQEERELSRTMNTKLDVMSTQLSDVIMVLSTGSPASTTHGIGKLR